MEPEINILKSAVSLPMKSGSVHCRRQNTHSAIDIDDDTGLHELLQSAGGSVVKDHDVIQGRAGSTKAPRNFNHQSIETNIE